MTRRRTPAAGRLSMGERLAPVPDAGCVMAELAACRHGVGVALVRVTICEARGPHAALDRMVVEHSCAYRLRLTRHRAVAIVDLPGSPRPEGAIVDGGPDVALSARSRELCALVLAGPRAPRLAASAAPGLRLLASFGEGDDLRLLVIARRDGPAALSALLAAGRGDGAVAVGRTTLGLLRAARRVTAAQRAASLSVTSPAPTPRGVPTA